MSTDNQFVKAITKLNELTKARQLNWRKENDTEQITLGTEDIVDVAYYAEHNGKRFRVYEHKYRETPNSPWETAAVLELVDDRDVGEWKFPYSIATWHLLQSVRFQTSGVEDFVASLIQDGSGTPFDESDLIADFSKISELKPDEIRRHASECRARLNRFGITTKAQLRQLVESRDILNWIKSVYVSELKRSPETALDPVAVAVWGGALISNGFNEQTKAQILNELRRSPEYREKNK